MDGVLVVDKPAGPTSHDVVAVARRALGTPRVGHTGTLDPLATGVLALVIGRATRLSQFLVGDDKEYLATVRFGTSTATYDAEGQVDDPSGADETPVAPAAVEAALAAFRGTYWQSPPPHSARKINGIPAYRLARANKAVPDRPAEVTVRSLELLACEHGVARLRIVCSSGFYVRTLAHELGQRLGCGAFLQALCRTRAGGFSLADAVPLDALAVDPAAAAGRLIPLGGLLTTLPAAVLNARGTRRASHGNSLRPEDLEREPEPDVTRAGVPGRVRLVDPAGALLGIATRDAAGVLHPAVVLV